MKHYRQGDLLIEQKRKGSVPATAKKTTDPVLAYGEITGHSHRVVNFDACEMFVDESGDIFITSEESVVIAHNEHADITLPPGTHCITRQREYDALAEDRAKRERQVAD